MEPIRVLVVDDEVDFASALAVRLRRRGYDAEAVFSGTAAIEQARKTEYDAILLDLKMPGMDGLETIRQLRKIDPHAQVVVLTGHGTVAAGIEGMQIGAADFLQKPADIGMLGTAIDAAAEATRELRGRGKTEGGES